MLDKSIDEDFHQLKRDFQHLLGDVEPEIIDDFIYSEQQEKAWLDSERELGQDFTKRIVTPLPTKRRRRVTLRNNIYMSLLLEVTNK
jgi:hypothetical protein